MNKLFEKHETLFCMLLIAVYILVNSVCVQNFGYTSCVSFIVNTILSVCLVGIVLLLKKSAFYGFKKVGNWKEYLYFLPLAAIVSVNLWNGFNINDSVSGVVFHILTMLNIGFIEELIFRGLVISRLKKGMGTAAAVVISAVIFGVVHGSALAVIYASLLGLLLGGLYARYDSVLPGMIFHVFFNMTSYWLPQEGTVLTVLYIVSAAAVLLCAWRIFLCYPAFSDIYTDVRDRLKPANEEEAAIIAEVKQHQRRGMITAEELEKLHDRWVENRKQIKKSKKYGRRK